MLKCIDIITFVFFKQFITIFSSAIQKININECQQTGCHIYKEYFLMLIALYDDFQQSIVLEVITEI